MRLASIQEYRRLFFTPDSQPSLNALRSQIREKKIPGGRILNGRYYVDLDEFDRVNNLHAQVQASLDRLKKSPALEGLL